MCYHRDVLTFLSSLAPWHFIDRGVRGCGGFGAFPSTRMGFFLGEEDGDLGRVKGLEMAQQ